MIETVQDKLRGGLVKITGTFQHEDTAGLVFALMLIATDHAAHAILKGVRLVDKVFK